jgi:hypothetical protein
MFNGRKVWIFAGALLLGWLMPAARASGAGAAGEKGAHEGAEESKNKTAAAPAGGAGAEADAGKSAASPAASAAFEAKLAELREELAAQKAALEAQQARIAQLESELHAAPSEPAGIALASAAVAPLAGSSQPAAAAIQPAEPQPGGTVKPGEQPAPDLSIRIGSAQFTPGGWADIAGIFRSTDIGSGTGTSFGSVPFNNTLPQARLSEFRATAQTSRLSLKVDAKITDATSVTGYFESDFNGFQPPNAYISTNSGSFRLRLFWADVKHGRWEVTGGQTWSLLTPNRIGLSALPADVFSTYRLDTNYVAGFTYARQAGFRVVYHPREWWAIGVALENPQQYAPGSVVFPGAAGYFAGQFDNGSGATNGTGAASNPAVPNLHPDGIVKSAFDWKASGRAFHVEAAGLIRSFKVYNNVAAPSETNSITEGSAAVNSNFELLPNFHLIADTFYGAGGGRYIGSLGPDAIVKAGGTLSPVHAGSGIGGFEWQITPRFLFDGYYSGAYFQRNWSLLASTATPAPSCGGISGFTCVGFGFPGSANSNNRAIQEATAGITRTLWGNANLGKLELITQSSYVVRSPWFVERGGPKNAHAFLQFVDLRYVFP